MNFFTDNTSATDSQLQDTLYPDLLSEADGIDLRIEMNRILYGSTFKKPLGHWVIVRVFDTSTRSKYFNRYSKEGIMGPAHDYVDHLVRTRRVPDSFGRSNIDEEKIAAMVDNKYIYYLEYDVPIRDGDQIYELDILDHTTIPTTYNFAGKYDVDRMHPYRLENGNVQYLSVVCKYNNITY